MRVSFEEMAEFTRPCPDALPHYRRDQGEGGRAIDGDCAADTPRGAAQDFDRYGGFSV
jgi:hypothetical protein